MSRTDICIDNSSVLTATIAKEYGIPGILERIEAHKTVGGLIIISKTGVVIRSNINSVALTEKYCVLGSFLPQLALDIRNIDPENELVYLQLTTSKQEIMMITDEELSVIVVKDIGEPSLQ